MEKEITLIDVMQICAIKSQIFLKLPWDKILPQYIEYVLCCPPKKYPLYFDLVKVADSHGRYSDRAREVQDTLDGIRSMCKNAIDSGEFKVPDSFE